MRCEQPAEAALLPESIAGLAAVIGWPAALRLVERAAGRSLVISRAVTPMMIEIAAWIGTEECRRLVAAYAVGTLYVPTCRAAARAERNRRIRDAVRTLERTMTTRQAVTITAGEWRLTERWVWACLSYKAPATNSPLDPALAQLILF